MQLGFYAPMIYVKDERYTSTIITMDEENDYFIQKDGKVGVTIDRQNERHISTDIVYAAFF